MLKHPSPRLLNWDVPSLERWNNWEAISSVAAGKEKHEVRRP